MRGLFRFLASSAGRVVRILAGVALILIGLFVVEGPVGWVLAVVGLVPLLAGIFDFCVFAPLAGLPFVGSKLREELK
jgi:predicted cobalt transporter CbtA